MSASSKKKLRKEQNAAKLAERLQKEAQEQRKTKITTIVFSVFIAAVLVAGLVLLAITGFRTSGIRQKYTTALTLGEDKMSSLEFNYFYVDNLNNEASNNSMMLQFQGLDLSKPLDEQIQDEEKQTTWADYFINKAAESARNTHALCNAAEEAGFAFPEDAEKELTDYMASVEFSATLQYGYPTLKDFLVANYGPGASVDSYKAYIRNNLMAQAYYDHYAETNCVYTDADRRAHEKDQYMNYSSFSYDTYYISYTTYLNVSSSDATEAQKEAARAAAKADAESLLSATNVDELDAAIKVLEVNKDKDVKASRVTNTLYSNISADQQKWLTATGRKAGDIAALPNEATLTDEDGKESTVVNGYTVIMYEGTSENLEPLANVRHLLVSFTGGTTDSNGNTTYSDADKAATKKTAEELLNTWKSGDATEDSFIELVKTKTDDTASIETGGLYEDITPASNYEPAFLSWSIDPERKAGDTGIVETAYGYHIMYYVGDSDINYRDSLIDAELMTAELEEWQNGLYEALTYTVGNTNLLKKDYVLQAAE